MEAILPIALLGAAFYLLILRPTQMRNRRAKDLKEHLRPGAEIITTAGVLGTVRSVEDDEIRLEIAPGVEIRMLTGAVGKILDPQDTAKAGETGAGETADDGGKGSGPASPSSH